jgi:hypothetical protein
LEGICGKYKSDRNNGGVDSGRGNLLVEALSREGDRHADRVLAVLASKIEDNENDPMLGMETFVARLAGLLRLESAAPLLVAKLKDDDSDFMNEECAQALTAIGDAAVDAIARDFSSAPEHFRRFYGSSALKDIRGEKAMATVLSLLKGEEDQEIQVRLVGTVLGNFDPQGLRLARELGITHLSELRQELIATALLTGEDFPDLERLCEEERGHLADVQERKDFLRGIFKTAMKPSAAESVAQPAIKPIKSNQKTGRNDPCPCGSGKKYKKCCMA